MQVNAVLFQINISNEQLHSVCYKSRKTTEAQHNYHSYELEVLAIVEAFKKFGIYLLGLHLKIITDCVADTREKRFSDKGNQEGIAGFRVRLYHRT